MAALGITFDAEQRSETVGRQVADELAEIDTVEDFPQVALAVFRSKFQAGALTDALTRVLLVLHMPELGGRRELLVVPVFDAGSRERGLEPCRIAPGVLGPAHAAALAHVEHAPHVCGSQSRQE